jgi:hypothetical protein
MQKNKQTHGIRQIVVVLHTAHVFFSPHIIMHIIAIIATIRKSLLVVCEINN